MPNLPLVAAWRARQQAANSLTARAEELAATAFQQALEARLGEVQAATTPDLTDDPWDDDPAPSGMLPI